MGEFSPVQLDALEDALEDLELSGIPSDLEDDEAVAERLGEYRALLSMSREALAVQDVPAGVLDGVLATAREGAASGMSVAADPDADAPPTSKPWWERLTGWIPVLAVGASAALVLVLVRGTFFSAPEAEAVAQAEALHTSEESEKSATPVSTPAPAVLEQEEALRAAAEPAEADLDEAPLGDVTMRGRLRGGALGPEPTDATDAKKGDVEAKPAPEPASSGAPARSPAGTGRKERPAQPKPSKKKSASKIPAFDRNEAPAAASDGESGREDPLSGAERDRRNGRCFAARSVFNRYVNDSDRSVRARALAGLGLCALAQGDETAAEAYFGRAAKSDASVRTFIERERAKLEPPRSKSKTSKKSG